jgi:epi-isozizaene 5-monooxygenase
MTLEPDTEPVTPEPRPTAPLPAPPLAGGAVPVLGHGWKLARDPLGFLSRLRADGDVVRLRMGPKTVYAVTAPALTGALALSPDYKIGGPLWESLEGLLGKEGVARWHSSS